MAVTLEIIHKDMQRIKKELSLLRHLVEEDYELSDEARQKLQKARVDMDSGEYVFHEEMMARHS